VPGSVGDSFAAPKPTHGDEAGTETGVLEGLVKIGPAVWSRKMRFTYYPDLRRPTPPPSESFSDREEIKNVVVYLESTSPLPPEVAAGNPGTYVMSQADSTFVPHVLPVLQGSTVEFPNSDPVFHNVFSLSKPATFDLGRYPKGGSKSVRFDKPGIVKVFCHLHSDMSAVVLVRDNPFFTIPQEEGGFRIDGIPPGEYRAYAWHERAELVTETVRIEPGRTAVIEFSIPIEDGGGGG
jgi:plastocyanin